MPEISKDTTLKGKILRIFEKEERKARRVGPVLSKEYKEKFLRAKKTLEEVERKTHLKEKDIDEALGAIRIVAEEYKRGWNLKPGEQTQPWEKGEHGVIVTEYGAKVAAGLPDASEKRVKKLVDAAFESCREDIRYNPVGATGGLFCIRLKLMDPRFKESIFHPERAVPEEAILKFPEKK